MRKPREADEMYTSFQQIKVNSEGKGADSCGDNGAAADDGNNR
jgi:hypothetical protein